ncbi:MAG: DUF4097 domain-containing protein [Gemmatimonadetes bacterium]|nr:DUF4097 domain-containing protein [Gemmatimonadota bacterium]
MRSSLRLLVLGVAVPGALSPLLYRTMVAQDENADVRVHRIVSVEAVPTPRAPAPPVASAAPHVRRPEMAPAAPRAPGRPSRPARSSRVAVLAMGDPQPCRFSHDERLQVPADAGLLLDVDAGSGSLSVEGVRGLPAVEMEVRECASREEWLADLEATLERTGDGIVVRTRYPEPGRSVRGERYARIDLVVRVPLDMPATLRDGSGEAWVSGTGRLAMVDGSGELEIRAINGAVRVQDGSGGLRLADIGGDLEIADSSGGIDLTDVDGSVTLTDGSGSVEATDVEGDVRVLRDGSGSIRVREVGGDFVVERDGSGSVRWTGVAGRVDVPRGSGHL